jgi:uncharacterized protein (DUF305 family)
MDFRAGNLLATGLAATFILAACGSPGSEPPRTSPEPRTTNRGPGRYPYTQADVDFMTHMIAHHAQALVMSGWAPSHGASPTIQRLAERIVNGQQDEIATMQRWLRDRNQPVPEPGARGKMGSAQHQHQMPITGMLTDAQMKQLDQARGRDFDRLFLTYMIQHHRGAITMVQQLFGTRGAAQDESTFKLASDVSADQSSEIARMESMLAALPSDQGGP